MLAARAGGGHALRAFCYGFGVVVGMFRPFCMILAVFFILAEPWYHVNMAKKNVRFTAVKTVTKPATVRFKTKSGETVSFKALKTFRMKEDVHFRARKK